MTRKELAKEIYRMSIELNIIQKTHVTANLFAKRLLACMGGLKAPSKVELESRYNDLVERLKVA